MVNDIDSINLTLKLLAGAAAFFAVVFAAFVWSMLSVGDTAGKALDKLQAEARARVLQREATAPSIPEKSWNLYFNAEQQAWLREAQRRHREQQQTTP